jgi:hypothetical protein
MRLLSATSPASNSGSVLDGAIRVGGIGPSPRARAAESAAESAATWGRGARLAGGPPGSRATSADRTGDTGDTGDTGAPVAVAVMVIGCAASAASTDRASA